MNDSTRAIGRGARITFESGWWVCDGSGHRTVVKEDESDPQAAVEEAARVWLAMVEADDALD